MVGSAILFGPSMLLVPLAPESFPVPFLVAGIALLSFAAVVLGAAGATASFVPLVLSPVRSLGPMEEALREHAPQLEPAVADA